MLILICKKKKMISNIKKALTQKIFIFGQSFLVSYQDKLLEFQLIL